MNAPVLIVIGLFFVIGITVGVVVVFAMAGVRSDRRAGPRVPRWYQSGGSDAQPSDQDEDHRASDERPRWPGDSGSWPGAE
jgi:hypothetical protein